MRVRVDRRPWWGTVALAIAASLTYVTAQQPATGGQIALDPDDIGGVVKSAKGPEAGVWVIAETKDFPTRMIKSVVTDDQGRYVIPDLPKASYDVFVRGYGLVDSKRVKATPGQKLDLTAVTAPDGKAAAEYYPASYWFSMMEIPKGPKSERELITTVKTCLQCHAIGTPGTRTIRKELGTGLAGWDARVKVGPSGATMSPTFQALGPQRKMFADWTDKIAAGGYPTEVPPRPQGAERNVVITQWDWAWPTGTRADMVATNETNPRVNANGPVYGVYTTEGKMAILDPVKNARSEVAFFPGQTAAAYGAGLRSLAMDEQGRTWNTASLTADDPKPTFCDSPANKFAKYAPLTGKQAKQLVMYDPKTKKVEKISTCFGVDHNHFGKEPDRPLYFGASNVVAWVSTATWDKTHNAEQSQGWCPAVLDTNKDGKITEGWTEPKDPIDPKKDHRINLSCYSITVNEEDGSLWCSGIGEDDHQLIRIERGANPPQTCKAELYAPPTPKEPMYKTGGTSIDHTGVAYVAFRGSDQVMTFDRRKCKSKEMASDKGDTCPEGWTTQTMQQGRPKLKGTASPADADMMYLSHIDRYNTLGLGDNVLVTGMVNGDSLQLFVPSQKKFMDIVIPYPMGFFSRSTNGRIDDPNTGWKGKGLWSNTSTYAPQHAEGGGTILPRAIKVQMRPDPLAK